MIPIRKNEELETLLNRSQFYYDDVNKTVKEIIKTVKIKKDEALFAYTKQFDNVNLKQFLVTKEEITQAINQLDQALINDLEIAYNNILEFHKLQLPNSYTIKKGVNSNVGQLIRPIESAGLYVPGGSAAYPSTVLMNAVPAKIAGVKKIVMVTPPQADGTIKPSILVAASIAGVDQIYKVGGAQAIAALAYGTESIPKVDKIVGPGNIYVSIAKKEVLGTVGIDMIAGPSEIVIIADEKANPTYVAADLMSQAEHDKLASSILVTTSNELAKQVQSEIRCQIKNLKRKEIIKESLQTYGGIIIVDSVNDAIDTVNRLAPEHLELLLKNATSYIDDIVNAGAIFIGEYSLEPLGDYIAGPNHTLPTSGTARFSQALSTTDFIKKISLINYSKQDLYPLKDSIIRLANEEGLTAHANAVKRRFDE